MFIGQVLHFAVCLFLGLACLAAAWLYLDAWTERHQTRELSKGLGFTLLTIGFLISGATWNDSTWINVVADSLRLIGYIAIAIGNLMTPLQPRPHTIDPLASAPTPPAVSTTPAFMFSPITLTAGLTILLPIAAFGIAILYWHRAYRGLERHLKPLALTFLILALSETLGLAGLWRQTSNPLLQPIIAPLGPIWIAQHIALILAAGVLAHWVWRYLTKRLLSQLFLTITSLTFTIVLIAITSVSALLLGNIQRDALTSLQTSSNVMTYAITAQTAATRSSAQVLAASPAITAAVNSSNHTALASALAPTLTNLKLTDVTVTSDTGVVLSRASDPDRSGDSLSDNALIQHALAGATVSSLIVSRTALGSALAVSTASPIIEGGRLIGLVLTTSALDNAFVDNLKHTTGLDVTLLAGTTRTASTLFNQGGTSRATGTTETNKHITTTAITQGKNWQGVVTTGGQSYLASYTPLKDVDNSVIGLLFVGQPQTAVLAGSRQAVTLTFLGAAAALLLITLPVYLIARQISHQLH